VFAEPWQAQAFAMALALHQRGVFTWTDWATLLGEEIQKARANGDPDDGSTYYRHWLATLERVVALKGIASSGVLDRYAHAGTMPPTARRTDRRSNSGPRTSARTVSS
jgi:nitrile hydratase accessory protein